MSLPTETTTEFSAVPLRHRLGWLNLGIPECMLLLVAAIWGGSYSVTKLATHQLPVLDFLYLRFGLTFLVLLPALRPLCGAQWLQGLLIGSTLGANLFAIFLCETFGVTLTSAANAAFLISLCVGFTPLFEWILFRKPFSSGLMCAVAVSVLGACLLSIDSTSHFSVGWGDGLILIAAMLRGLMVCLTRRFAYAHRLPALTLTAVQAGVITVGSYVLLLVFPKVAGHTMLSPILTLAEMNPLFWGQMGFLIVFCTIFAFFAQNFAASRTGPTKVALLMGSEPVFGALFAILWLGESIPYLGWVGGTLIVMSTVFASALKSK